MTDSPRAYNMAITLLARREHAKHELIQKLTQKGFTAEEIEAALQTLVDHDLQSDARYAEMITRSKREKGYGDRYIRQLLNHQGIEMTHENSEGFSSREAIKKLIQKRKLDLSVPKEKDKMIRYLLRRGFDSDDIFSVINAREN